MAKKQSRAEETIQKIEPISDKELDRLWLEHIKDYTNRGITLTFKPVRFFTSKERTELDRIIHGADLPPTQEELKRYPTIKE